MPKSPDQFAAIENLLNRLAAESVLAQPGRDDGLIPAYSLLGELRDLCAGEAELLAATTSTRAVLEKLLDAARPFDAGAIGELIRLVEWMSVALAQAATGQPIIAFASKPPPTAPAATNAEDAEQPVAADSILEFSLRDNRELFAEFHAETVDHLQQIEAALLVLDREQNHPEALNSIFRSFHTIKGNAGFLGLLPIHTLAHEVESLLDLARNRKLVLNAPTITEILRSRDALQTLTQQVGAALERGRLPDRIVPVQHLIRAVRHLAGNAGTAPALSVTARPASIPVEMKAPSVNPRAPKVETLAPVIPLSAAAEALPSVPVVSKTPPGGATPKAAASATVRVNTEKLDSLMDVVGELVIVQSQLLESSRSAAQGNPALQRNVAQLSRIAKGLQSTAMSLRMIPVKPTFQKMERLARDLARDAGKKVAFVTTGDETELDRTVVEEIGDPLVHMVRNALDHGLEAPAVRVAAGKGEMGTVQLRAYHQGSNIVIEMQDDGRGIDPEKILRKAIEKGLVAEGEPLSHDEILALIFAPGFSTAEKVTAVSGRGVGMDVVKRNIEKLRGKIEITSVVGQGSTFKIKLPLTMAIIDGLVVRVGGDRFILPSTAVQMALRPLRANISTLHGQGEVLDLRGRFVPIHRLDQRFNISGDAKDAVDGIVVIIENSGKLSALLVDEMISKQEVVIKNLGAFMQSLPGVAGAAILGDGNIALILDPGSLLTAA